MLCHRVAFYRHGRTSQVLLHLPTRVQADPSSWVAVSPRQHFRLLAACPGACCTHHTTQDNTSHHRSALQYTHAPQIALPRREPGNLALRARSSSVPYTPGLNQSARRQAMREDFGGEECCSREMSPSPGREAGQGSLKQRRNAAPFTRSGIVNGNEPTTSALCDVRFRHPVKSVGRNNGRNALTNG